MASIPFKGIGKTVLISSSLGILIYAGINLCSREEDNSRFSMQDKTVSAGFSEFNSTETNLSDFSDIDRFSDQRLSLEECLDEECIRAEQDRMSKIINLVITESDSSIQRAYSTAAPEMDKTLRDAESEIIGYLLKTRERFQHPGDKLTVFRSKESELAGKFGDLGIMGFELERNGNIIYSAVNEKGIFYDTETGNPFIDVFVPIKGDYLLTQEYKAGHQAWDLGSSETGKYSHDQAWRYDNSGNLILVPAKKGNTERKIGNAYLSPFDAEVVEIGYKSKIGNYVVLKADKTIDNNSLFIIGGHLSAYSFNEKGELKEGPLVDVGDRVSQGDKIAYIGHSGSAGNLHLHLVCVTGYNPSGKKENIPFSKQNLKNYHPLKVLPEIDELPEELRSTLYQNPEDIVEYRK
jgi:hypothetical protein